MLRCRDQITVAVAVSLSAVAHAQSIAGPPLNAQAQVHFDKALAAYSAANYRAASVEFEIAYGLDGRRELMFAWAQAERLSGDCDRAVMLYRRFLDQSPSEAEAAKATRQIERCHVSTQPTTPAPVPPASDEDLAVQRTPTVRHWYSDPWAAGLVAGGAVAMAAGGVVMWTVRSDDDAANRATLYGDALRLADEADRHRLIGTITLASGGALVLGGLALGWWSERTWTPQVGAATVGIAGAF